MDINTPLWGVRVQAPFGAWVQRVQRVQRVAVGAFWKYKGASLYKTFTTGLSPVGKPYNRPGGRGNAPLLVAGATTFPPPAGNAIKLREKRAKYVF